MLAYSCALFAKVYFATPLESAASALFAKNKGGWGYLPLTHLKFLFRFSPVEGAK